MSLSRRIAAIDLGTNTTLMLVAEIDAANVLKALEDRATITRLGRGVDKTRLLDTVAIERTLNVLREYAMVARGWGAPIVAVGTSALRDASNRHEFLAPARQILGCEVEVIAGAREAELTFHGALEGIDVGADPITVIDIGGGSTEIVVGEAGKIVQRTSLDFGSVRMHERHRVQAPATPQQRSDVRADVDAILAASQLTPSSRVLAIAGTATTLAAITHRVDPYERIRIHGSELTRLDLAEQVDRLMVATLADRKRIPGLHPDRADVIFCGGVILEAVLDWCRATRVTVSDGGVRYGLARQALAAIGSP